MQKQPPCWPVGPKREQLVAAQAASLHVDDASVGIVKGSHRGASHPERSGAEATPVRVADVARQRPNTGDPPLLGISQAVPVVLGVDADEVHLVRDETARRQELGNLFLTDLAPRREERRYGGFPPEICECHPAFASELWQVPAFSGGVSDVRFRPQHDEERHEGDAYCSGYAGVANGAFSSLAPAPVLRFPTPSFAALGSVPTSHCALNEARLDMIPQPGRKTVQKATFSGAL
jgi:hypothetical protein